MGRELVSLKGTKDGLILSIAPDSDFDVVLESLRTRLAPAKDFWAGAVVKLETIPAGWTDKEREKLLSVLGEFNMSIQVDYFQPKQDGAIGHRIPASSFQREGNNALLIRRNLRSGQRIYHDGHLVIMGDVNPGAEIVATGDIVVLGALRGMAHAGADGNVKATVMALRLEPVQLRIAQFISRSPDEKLDPPRVPEIAFVKDDRIAVQEYQP